MIAKWLIFFCCYTGNADESMGSIYITQDTVKAFNITWVVNTHSYIEAAGVLVYKGTLFLTSVEDGTEAVVDIRGKHITFTIPGVETAMMTQVTHKEVYYDDNYVRLRDEFNQYGFKVKQKRQKQ